MYTLKFDSGFVYNLVKGDKTQYYLIAFGICAIAEKYDIEWMHEPIADSLEKQIGCNFRRTELKNFINAYYQSCVRVDTPVGKVLASLVLERHHWFTTPDSTAYTTLLKRHPAFSADMAIRYTWFEQQTCDECGITIAVDAARASKSVNVAHFQYKGNERVDCDDSQVFGLDDWWNY